MNRTGSGKSHDEQTAAKRQEFDRSADAEIPDVHDDPSWSKESARRFGMLRRQRARAFLRQWWPPTLRRALYDWQQLADEQEMELAELRGRAYAVVNSFDRKPTEGCVKDVIGLAESLRRYREMVHGRAVERGFRKQGVMPRGR